MSENWLKMRNNLQSHPKVVRMASALNADKFRIIGGLHAVWCLFDEHSIDGSLDGYSGKTIDDLTGFPGISKAMIGVNWLVVSKDASTLPEFESHNGQGAKRRAQEAKRKAAERAQSVQILSASEADKLRTREDKIRVDKKKTESANASLILPDWMPTEAWDGYVEMRKKIKAPLTDRAVKLKIGELEKFKEAGFDITSILDKSTSNNWKDLYEPKNGSPAQSTQTSFV